MPIISRAHDPEELIRQGLIIDSIISRPGSEPSEEGHPLKMLVDTGASISGISGEIAEEIGLPQVGIQEMGTAGGTVETTVYTGKVMFEPQHPWRRSQIQLMEVDFTGQENCDGVIGRELLSQSMLTWIGFTGTCILSD